MIDDQLHTLYTFYMFYTAKKRKMNTIKMTQRVVVAVVALGGTAAGFANPIFDGWYADPQVRKYDEWRICYHRRPIPNKGPHHRVVCIDRMEFDVNGDIKPVEMTE